MKKNLWVTFWKKHLFPFCLSFPKWCNTYTFVEEIKALEYQIFSTHFLSKFIFESPKNWRFSPTCDFHPYPSRRLSLIFFFTRIRGCSFVNCQLCLWTVVSHLCKELSWLKGDRKASFYMWLWQWMEWPQNLHATSIHLASIHHRVTFCMSYIG